MRIGPGLYHKNGLVRKATTAALQVPRLFDRWTQTEGMREGNPAVLVNSVPKSGTHLLEQIAMGLPNRRNYGAFLSSMTSSFRFRERTESSTLRVIRSILARELVRGHLFYSPQYEQALHACGVVHYFIYRDPRDVVVSESNYLRSTLRWHRLHPIFRDLPSIEDSYTLSIRGLEGRMSQFDYPNIAERYGRYSPWLDSSTVCAVRFEDLVGPRRETSLRRLAEFYARRLNFDIDLKILVDKMRSNIAPERSHTFRKGKSGGWRQRFTAEHRRLFGKLAGDLLVRLGYETDDGWIHESGEEDKEDAQVDDAREELVAS